MNTNIELVEVDADLEDLIPNFIQNRKKDIIDLNQMIQTKDLHAISQMAHRIKGSSSGYGFMGLSQIAAEIEQLSKNGNFEGIPALYEKMNSYFDKIQVRYV